MCCGPIWHGKKYGDGTNCTCIMRRQLGDQSKGIRKGNGNSTSTGEVYNVPRAAHTGRPAFWVGATLGLPIGMTVSLPAVSTTSRVRSGPYCSYCGIDGTQQVTNTMDVPLTQNCARHAHTGEHYFQMAEQKARGNWQRTDRRQFTISLPIAHN
jgi:hypothetical protein